MQHQKNYNERYSIRNECVKSGFLMNVRILKRLSSKTEAVLRSNAYLSSQTELKNLTEKREMLSFAF